jgi:hypothetical protein
MRPMCFALVIYRRQRSPPPDMSRRAAEKWFHVCFDATGSGYLVTPTCKKAPQYSLGLDRPCLARGVSSSVQPTKGGLAQRHLAVSPRPHGFDRSPMTVRGGAVPYPGMACMRHTEWVRRLGASLPMRITASWSGSLTHRIEGCGTHVRAPHASSPRLRHHPDPS